MLLPRGGFGGTDVSTPRWCGDQGDIMPRKKKTEETQTETTTTIETPSEPLAETPVAELPATEIVPDPEPPKPKKGRKKKEPAISGVATLADLAAAYAVQMENDGKSNGTIASYSMELKL